MYSTRVPMSRRLSVPDISNVITRVVSLCVKVLTFALIFCTTFFSLGTIVDATAAAQTPAQLRVVHFDLDPLFSPGDSPAQVTTNINMLVQRVSALSAPGIDLVVYLSAFSNPDATQKSYDHVFFPSAHLNERAGTLLFDDAELPTGQLLARTARAIKQVASNVQIYAWMPTLNFRLVPTSFYYTRSLNSYIQSDLAQERNDPNRYARLSPFVGATWDIVAQIYRELGWAAGNYIDGIVFHDDGMISDHEDASVAATRFLTSYDWRALADGDARNWSQLNATERGIRKSRYLNQFTLYMAAQTQNALNDKFGLNKTLRTARHVYSTAFSNRDAVQWLAQEPVSLLQDYDYVLIEAYPYLEARNDPTNPLAAATFCGVSFVKGCKVFKTGPYFAELFSAVTGYPEGLNKVVFIMQTVDWNTHTGAVTDLTSNRIGDDMMTLFQQGAQHFGWYPDRYFSGAEHPDIKGNFNDALFARH